MVANVVSITIDAVGSLMTLYGAVYVISLSRPVFFYETFATRANPQTKMGAVRFYSLVILKAVAVGKFFYHASSGIFDIIPANWMRYDEDGEIEGSTREFLEWLFAFFAAAFAFDGEGKVSKLAKHQLELERSERGW